MRKKFYYPPHMVVVKLSEKNCLLQTSNTGNGVIPENLNQNEYEF